MTSFHQKYRDTNARSGADPVQLTLDHVSPATLLLEKRREMLEIQQALDSQKEEYGRKQAMFRRREQQLRKKDLELQENLCQFNKFLKDKSDKRQQYLKKSEDEKRVKLQKDKEIQQKHNELKSIIKICNSLELEFKEHEKYEKYLEKIKQKSYQDFPEIEYILKRYNLLNDARKSLELKEESSSAELEQLRLQLMEYTKEQNNKYLDLNNEKQRLQRNLENSINELNELQSKMAKIVERNTGRNRQLGQLIMCSRNVYSRCRHYLRGIHHFQDLNLDQDDTDLEGDEREGDEKKDLLLSPKSAVAKDAARNQVVDVQHMDEAFIKKEISQKLQIIAHYIKDCKHIVTQSG